VSAQKVVRGFRAVQGAPFARKSSEARAAEFGFDKKRNHALVHDRRKERKLVVGGIAPGAGDTYVLDPSSTSYVLKTIRCAIWSGELRLLEREQHLQNLDVAQLVTAGGKARQFVAGKDPENKKSSASDPATRKRPTRPPATGCRRSPTFASTSTREDAGGNTGGRAHRHDGPSGNLVTSSFRERPPPRGSAMKADY